MVESRKSWGKNWNTSSCRWTRHDVRHRVLTGARYWLSNVFESATGFFNTNHQPPYCVINKRAPSEDQSLTLTYLTGVLSGSNVVVLMVFTQLKCVGYVRTDPAWWVHMTYLRYSNLLIVSEKRCALLWSLQGAFPFLTMREHCFYLWWNIGQAYAPSNACGVWDCLFHSQK